ncbi:MAG: toprim domain-containing protein [Verrucomicrobiota bacterium]
MKYDALALKGVDLLTVMKKLGFEPSKGYAGTIEFNLSEDRQIAVTPKPLNARNGNLGMFQFWKGSGLNGRSGGAGAIDLVMAVTNKPFGAALEWLAESFFPSSEALGLSNRPSSGIVFPPSETRFSLPERHPAANGVVRKYLCAIRGLSPRLIVPLMKEGIIYPHLHQYKAGGQLRTFTNAVFLMRDDQTQAPNGCMIRGCYDGLKPRKSTLPFRSGDGAAFWVGTPLREARRIILAESPIECLSWVVLHGLESGIHCRTYGGNRWRAVKTLFEQVKANAAEIVCAFNSDDEGQAAALELRTLCLEEGVCSSESLPAGAKDWNELLRKKS